MRVCVKSVYLCSAFCIYRLDAEVEVSQDIRYRAE